MANELITFNAVSSTVSNVSTSLTNIRTLLAKNRALSKRDEVILEENLKALRIALRQNNQRQLYAQAVAAITEADNILKQNTLPEQIKRRLLEYQVNTIIGYLEDYSRSFFKGWV